MSRSRKHPIPTQRNTKSKTTFSLVLLHNLGRLTRHIPDYNLSIMRRSSQKLSILVQCKRPYLSNLFIVWNLEMKGELWCISSISMNFDRAFEAGRGECGAGQGG